MRPNAHISNPRSFRPNHYASVDDSRKQILRLSPVRASGSRRNYQRSFTIDETAKSHSLDLVENPSLKSRKGESSENIDAVNSVNSASLSSGLANADKGFGDKKDTSKNILDKVDPEREALMGSQQEYIDISSESEESNRAASDVDLDREYRKLSFTTRGRFIQRRKVERSLADPEPVETENSPSNFFIPTPIPGFLYPKSAEIIDDATSEVVEKGNNNFFYLI